MKTASVALKAHYALPVTTIARCWKCTRADGTVFGFTNVDRDLVVGGVTYSAATGFMASAMEQELDLSVPNLELAGILDSTSITEADIVAGKWDATTVEIFEVNYADLTQGIMVLRQGVLGKISAGKSGFTAEGRGLAQLLQQSVGRTYAAACDANLGDTRCTIDLTPFTVTGSVTTATSSRIFADSTRSEAADWFGGGVFTWTSGANVGLRMEVAQFSAGVFTLHLPMPYPIVAGDTYSAVPGCRKRRTEDCKNKFSNVVNFRGFPDVPLNDKVLGNATAADAPQT